MKMKDSAYYGMKVLDYDHHETAVFKELMKGGLVYPYYVIVYIKEVF
ncbi:hypothetical protein GCM10023310_34210 [Paenibacillus vulneris]